MKKILILIIATTLVGIIYGALTVGTYGFVTTAPTTTSTGVNDYNVLYDNEIQANKYTTPASAINVSEIGYFRVAYYPAGTYYYGAIYEDSGGVPGNLVGYSDLTQTTASANCWERASCDIDLDASTDYWIAIYVDSGENKADLFGGGAVSKYRTGVASLPDPFGTASSGTQQFCFYALYTERSTNMQINISDAWKDIEGVQVNIGDVWKEVEGVQINIGDTWKEVY